jgi:serine/threonine protein kinase
MCKPIKEISAFFGQGFLVYFTSTIAVRKGGFGLVKILETQSKDPLVPPILAVKLLDLPILPMVRTSADKCEAKKFKTLSWMARNELATALTVSKHPTFVKTWGCFWSGEPDVGPSIYLVMDAMAERSIQQPPQKKALTPTSVFTSTFLKKSPVEKLTIFRGLAQQVEILHTKEKIVHNDIKASNIMFKDKALTEAKLIDFGSAFMEGWPITTYTKCYADAEVHTDGRGSFGNDIFGLGIAFGEIELQTTEYADSVVSPTRVWYRIFYPEKYQAETQARNDLVERLERQSEWTKHFGDYSFWSLIKMMTKVKREERIESISKVVRWLDFLIWVHQNPKAPNADMKKHFELVNGVNIKKLV